MFILEDGKRKKKISKRAIESGIEIFEPPTYQDS